MEKVTAKAVNPRYVAIKPLPLEEQSGDVLKKTGQETEKDLKKQNRGRVIMIGSKCDPWIEVGDLASFYRAASTPVMFGEHGEVELVHEDHVLCSFR